jgi:hypothetical protein
MGTPGVKDGPPLRQPHPKDRPYRNQRQVRPHPEKENILVTKRLHEDDPATAAQA